jgi:hypothetical protein
MHIKLMMSSIKVENSELFRLNIRKKLNEIIGDDKKSNNLEKGIFNYSLNESITHLNNTPMHPLY